MARRTEHALVGAAIGAIGGVAYSMETHGLGNNAAPAVLASVVVGTISGCLPDLLEPPRFPGHRGVFHSILFLGVLGAGASGIIRRLEESDLEPRLKRLYAVLVVIAVLGVASHLVLDWRTPMGISLAG